MTDPTTVDPGARPQHLGVQRQPRRGLQNTAGDAISAAGWPNPARANADQRDEETTVVYYRSAEFEGIALGLAQLLGVGTVQLSDTFLGAPVTIVLGADYATSRAPRPDPRCAWPDPRGRPT